MSDRMTLSLDLEIEEIESREKAAGHCTSSTTSRHCTCRCILVSSATVETNQ